MNTTGFSATLPLLCLFFLSLIVIESKAQNQIRPKRDTNYYEVSQSFAVSQFDYQNNKITQDSFWVQSDTKFNVIKRHLDEGGKIECYVVKFWEFNTDTNQLTTRINRLDRKRLPNSKSKKQNIINYHKSIASINQDILETQQTISKEAIKFATGENKLDAYTHFYVPDSIFNTTFVDSTFTTAITLSESQGLITVEISNYFKDIKHPDTIPYSEQTAFISTITPHHQKLNDLNNKKTMARSKLSVGSKKHMGKPKYLNLTSEINQLNAQKRAITHPSTHQIGVETNGLLFAISPKFFNHLFINTVTNDTLKSDKKTELQFVGAGDIQKSISEGTTPSANTGLGIILNQTNSSKRTYISSFEIDFSINVASTSDTINAIYKNGQITNVRDFGTYILLPMNSGQATRLRALTYLNTDKLILNKNSGNKHYSLAHFISGIQTSFIASNRVWNLTEQPDTAIFLHSSGIAFKLGIFHDFIPKQIRQTQNMSIRLGVNYSLRGIYGDAGFEDNFTSEARQNLLNTTTKIYQGFEFDLTIRIKNLEARAGLTRLYGSNANPLTTNIPGLTDTQFVTSITFVGGFPVKLKK
jgi:hypothetical protein